MIDYFISCTYIFVNIVTRSCTLSIIFKIFLLIVSHVTLFLKLLVIFQFSFCVFLMLLLLPGEIQFLSFKLFFFFFKETLLVMLHDMHTVQIILDIVTIISSSFQDTFCVFMAKRLDSSVCNSGCALAY